MNKRKFPYVHPNVSRKLHAGHTRIKTMSRATTIRIDFTYAFFYLYNGQHYRLIRPDVHCVGYKLGELNKVGTKERCVYRRRKKKKKKKYRK